MMVVTEHVTAQNAVNWSVFPDLPDEQGFAGMFAGVSHNTLIAMGGANFPGKRPWEGGKKKWYSDIYVLQHGTKWVKASEKLIAPAAYGISVSYKDKVIVVGGSNDQGHSSLVKGYEWDGERIRQSDYPDLPVPLANMGGGLLENMIVVFGGNDSPAAVASKRCYGLDLSDVSSGWHELEAWPGPERIFPVCAFYRGQGYMFGGETTGVNAKGKTFRSILSDSYKLTLNKKSTGWSAHWEKLVAMPRGASAGGSTLPVLNDKLFFWGGVDAVTAQYKDAATHPGITRSLLYYYPEIDSWEYIGEQTGFPSRVTLPVVLYNGKWMYVSGEIKAGIRTPTVVGVN
nr:hypothetical protein [uncultured Dyadobacter sp.]